MNRSITKPVWKVLHRMQRIAAREASLALPDLVIFGRSYVKYGDTAHDSCQHIPVNKIEGNTRQIK